MASDGVRFYQNLGATFLTLTFNLARLRASVRKYKIGTIVVRFRPELG
jgi:hypothetical protein